MKSIKIIKANGVEISVSVGEIAMCWYYDWNQPPKLELFFCQIIKLGEEYSTCKLFIGEELNTSRVYGTFKDVCTAY